MMLKSKSKNKTIYREGFDLKWTLWEKWKNTLREIQEQQVNRNHLKPEQSFKEEIIFKR